MKQDQGYAQGKEVNIQSSMDKLDALIVSVRSYYEQLPEKELTEQPSPGKWSRKQILGHLIDSAVNNLKRFTDAQVLEQPYTVIGYRQDDLMILNNYQHLPLEHLLNLWQSLNRQIVFVVRLIPQDKLAYEIKVHNNPSAVYTLTWLIGDYVAHMEHHLEQNKRQ